MNETKSRMSEPTHKKRLLIELQYLPPVSSFVKMLECGTVLFEQHENYLKRSYRNRIHILSANGILKLSIPLAKGKNQRLPIREVEVFYTDNWQNLHWRSIQSAYGRAPYYEFYADELKAIYDEKVETLFDFNLKLFQCVLELLQLDISIEFTSQYDKTPAEGIIDFRNKILPTRPLANNTQLESYNQVFEDKFGFVENLSILDLLFCYGTQAISVLEASKV